MDVIQQRIREREQKDLRNNLQIVGIPYLDNEDIREIAEKMASYLNQETTGIKNIKRVSTSQGKIGIIKMEMHDEDTKNKWIKEAKSKLMTVDNLIKGMDTQIAKGKIFVREELTHYNKTLLWKTKQACKDKYKFVWCKEGRIMVRKSENEEILVIRTDEDIKQLTNYVP